MEEYFFLCGKLINIFREKNLSSGVLEFLGGDFYFYQSGKRLNFPGTFGTFYIFLVPGESKLNDYLISQNDYLIL